MSCSQENQFLALHPSAANAMMMLLSLMLVIYVKDLWTSRPPRALGGSSIDQVSDQRPTWTMRSQRALVPIGL